MPAQCVVSPLTEDTSSYSFFLGAPVVQWAESQDVKYVQVEQVCNRPMGKKSGDEPGHSSLVRQAMDAPEWGRDEDEETWSVSGTTSFKSRDQHDVTSALPNQSGSMADETSGRHSSLQRGQSGGEILSDIPLRCER